MLSAFEPAVGPIVLAVAVGLDARRVGRQPGAASPLRCVADEAGHRSG